MQTTTFGDLTVRFDDGVLRPRAWTIAQSRWAAELAAGVPDGPILELCAGVGHIGLHLASLVRRRLVLVDADAAACEHARFNVDLADLPLGAEVRHGPVDAALGEAERFPLILADPPWVPSRDTAAYPQDPVWAIDGGPDGLELARACVEVIGHHLDDAGVAVLQLGTEEQATRMQDHLASRPDLALRVAEVRPVPDESGTLARLSR